MVQPKAEHPKGKGLMRKRPAPLYRQYFRRAVGKIRHLHREAVIRSRTIRDRGSMPAFIIVGAQKAATTSLYDALVSGPGIESAYLKEVHFFDHFYNKGPAWYRAHFPDDGSSGISGEASPSYLFHPLAAARIRETVGVIQIIILLRNPVDRAISHYWHEVSHGRERRTAGEALLADETEIAERLKELGATGRGWGETLMRRSYKTRGIYLPQLRRYFELFGRDAVKVIGFREFARSPHLVTNDIRLRLGLASDESDGPSLHSNRRLVNRPIPDFVKEKLENYFAPFNEELCSYLGELPEW